eukprot:s3270_g2.t1
MCEGDGIRWQTLVGPNPTDVLTLPFEEARRSLSYQTYWETYGVQHSAGVQAQLREQLKDWSADVALQDRTLSIICCPEDKECWKRCPKHKICENCRAPVCHYCRQDLKRQKQAPTLALANDMLIFYPPRQIYSKEVTFMELVCASPCFTAMACFSLEKKLLGDRALDQDAFMPRNRLVARGNATTFPLAWEELLQSMQEAAEQAHEGTLRLPKVGADLSAVMSVIIKAGGPNSNLADTASIIHQARVRRTIVLELLADAKAREHPAYIQVNMEDAVQRADQLPEDGVPEELIALLPYDDDLDNIQRQKAATPVRNMLVPAEVQEEFAHMTAAGQGDENAQHAAALHAIAAGSQHAMHGADDAIVIHTGNRLLDQFEPWYFAFAFAFLFPYGTGMPDPPAWSTKPRYRRPPDAPQVDLSAWMRCMARRCEAQVNRDWTFGFTTWNLFFRSSINLARTIAPYDTPIFDETQGKFCALTSVDIEAGAVQLVKALDGTYCDSRGNMRAVKGDVSKLPYVKNLRPAARKLLQNMRHTARALPGTQEARRQMRFEISAMRIRYGVPLFITVSPDEAHQWLFVRMARTRASDPVRNAFPCQEWMSGDRDFPPLDDDILFPIHVERLRYQNTKFVKTQPAPGSGARHLREAVEAQAYGHRPSDSECWWLSPYEFVMYWKLVPTKVPYSRAEWEAAPQDGWDVKLTAAGLKKMDGSELKAPARLKPGVHYVIQIPPTCDRLLFPPGGPTQTLRHNWYLERRVRPRCPHFASAPVPKGFAENAEHNAKLTSVYFRAWTLDVNSATSTIPYLGHLRGEEDSWESSLRAWLLRLPSAETKRHVGNFLSVYRVRPAADADNNSDDDDVKGWKTLVPQGLSPTLLKDELGATFLLPNVAFETRLKYQVKGWKTLVSQGLSPALLKDELGATFLLPNVAFETRLKYQVEGWKTLVSQGLSPTLLKDELGATFLVPNVAFETRLKYQVEGLPTLISQGFSPTLLKDELGATFLLPNVAFETRLKYQVKGWKTLVSQGLSPALLKDELGATFLLPNVAFETRLKYQVEGWKTLVSQGLSPTLLKDELGATFLVPNVAFETRLKYQVEGLPTLISQGFSPTLLKDELGAQAPPPQSFTSPSKLA